ncbi:MAG: PilZ domain-containing protein [Dissulfuribacterales bacterium]
MNNQKMGNKKDERRGEQRKITDLYYSVEFSIKGLAYLYQFKLRDISQNGLCIMVKEGSPVLQNIKVDNLLDMKYYSVETPDKTDKIITKVKHITKHAQGRFQGHSLVGLEILKKE